MGLARVSWWKLLGVLVLSACAHSALPSAEEPEDPFRIGREDVLDIAVWREPELSRTLPVRPDGYISLPIAGDLLAAGLTPRELASAIHEALTPYVREPRVTVIVHEVNSSRVFVTGEVAHPGAYPLRGRVSLLQAIALAGGFTEFADRDAIRIIRVDGKSLLVGYGDILDAPEAPPLRLRPGDTIIVP